MALIKEIDTEYGIPASYWKIGMLSVDRNRKEANFTLYLYVKKGESKPISEFVVTLFGMENGEEVFDKYFENTQPEFFNIYKSCYLLAKNEVEFFADALDDPDELSLLETE